MFVNLIAQIIVDPERRAVLNRVLLDLRGCLKTGSDASDMVNVTLNHYNTT